MNQDKYQRANAWASQDLIVKLPKPLQQETQAVQYNSSNQMPYINGDVFRNLKLFNQPQPFNL